MARDLDHHVDDETTLDDWQPDRSHDNPAPGVDSVPLTPGVFNQPPSPAGGWIQAAERKAALKHEDEESGR